MPRIDPTARVADGAQLAEDVEVGPYCVVGPGVELRSGVRLLSQVSIMGATVIGERTVVYPFASLGSPPQSARYRGGPTRLVIGRDCQIREYVTANTGTEDDRGVTEIGDKCFLMAGAHVAHDCRVGNNVVFANNAVIGGHVEVGDYVFLGGHCAIHQFVRLGESVMVAGYSAIREDVIPFGYVLYPVGRLAGINVVGMKRRGFERDDIRSVRAVYQRLFEGDGNFDDRLKAVTSLTEQRPAVETIIAFLRAGKRPLMTTTPRGNPDAE